MSKNLTNTVTITHRPHNNGGDGWAAIVTVVLVGCAAAVVALAVALLFAAVLAALIYSTIKVIAVAVRELRALSAKQAMMVATDPPKEER